MTTISGVSDTITERLTAKHARGLDQRYDDVLAARHADATDAALMASGCHYDYRAQTWLDGHDHAHIVSNDPTAPLLFCGADAVSCVGVEL